MMEPLAAGNIRSRSDQDLNHSMLIIDLESYPESLPSWCFKSLLENSYSRLNWLLLLSLNVKSVFPKALNPNLHAYRECETDQ